MPRGRIARLIRLVRIAHRELLARRLPHGLLSWRYLWPGDDARIRHHRQLWWANRGRWPRPLWLAVQSWQWLRWLLWGAWRSGWRAVRRLGPEVAAREGIGLSRQALRVLRLALGWCITPADSYRFGLVRQPDRALEFVYDHHHLLRSAPLGLKRGSLTLLGDKLALADQLRAQGIPMVTTHRTIIQTAPELSLIEALDGLEQAFCKRRHGNQSEGHSASGAPSRASPGAPSAAGGWTTSPPWSRPGGSCARSTMCGSSHAFKTIPL